MPKFRSIFSDSRLVLMLLLCCSCSFLIACSSGSSAAERSDNGDPGQQASDQLLGKLDFPNSGSKEAQNDFLSGVLYLHNFEYADARRAFQAAQEIDPDFAMAYWGEAMTHNHPIWMRQDQEAATTALAKYAPTPTEQLAKIETDREKAYFSTLHTLYGLSEVTEDLDKDTRDDRYRVAMQELSEQYPDDHEARAFHALSILGTAHEGRDFRTYMQAAATADDVWDANPQHPGAAHYLIHSFDDPVHAPLGLPMARTYAKIAPDAAHAQHMTSHIFVALGLWDDVATANEAARRVQTARQRELEEAETVCGHYPYWLQYSYLQLGRIQDAREVLRTCEERIKGDEPTNGELQHYALMRGRQILDGTPGESEEVPLLVDIDKEVTGFSDHLFLSAYQAALNGDLRKAKAAIAPLRDSESWFGEKVTEVQALQVKGLIEIAEGKTKAGLRTLRDAALMEEAMPYAFGPPEILMPTWELLGLQQLKAGESATEAFQNQLARTPRRVNALKGLAAALRADGEAERANKVQQELDAIAATA